MHIGHFGSRRPSPDNTGQARHIYGCVLATSRPNVAGACSAAQSATLTGSSRTLACRTLSLCALLWYIGVSTAASGACDAARMARLVLAHHCPHVLAWQQRAGVHRRQGERAARWLVGLELVNICSGCVWAEHEQSKILKR